MTRLARLSWGSEPHPSDPDDSMVCYVTDGNRWMSGVFLRRDFLDYDLRSKIESEMWEAWNKGPAVSG